MLKPYNISSIKNDFPIFKHHPDLVYLDSTATALKPEPVIAAMNEYYEHYSANVFRGAYELSEKATGMYEGAREQVAQFIHAHTPAEIIFTRNTTESINLIATAWGKHHIHKGDAIVTSIMEHHSNFVPWQQLCLQQGADFVIVDIDPETGMFFTNSKSGKKGQRSIEACITKKTKLVAITHISNVLGTINPVRDIIRAIKKINPATKVLVDAAQSVPHQAVDVQDLGCDFFAFSGHKMMGPTGIGVLWMSEDVAQEVQPYQYGGEMIREVYRTHTTFKPCPHKFEAGTPHIAGVIGLGAAIRYLQSLGMEHVRHHEIQLTAYALKQLLRIPYINIYGPKSAVDKAGIVAFNVFTNSGKLIHGHDVVEIIKNKQICIRTGNHCAMPLHETLGLTGSARASFYIYNTEHDIDVLIEGLEQVLSIFNRQ